MWRKKVPADDVESRRIEPIVGVTRVQTDRGSHIEPQYDDAWPVERRLGWKLAVFEIDTGVRATLYDSHYTINGHPVRPIQYSVTLPGMSMSGGDEHDVWRTLSDLSSGIQIGRILASSSKGTNA